MSYPNFSLGCGQREGLCSEAMHLVNGPGQLFFNNVLFCSMEYASRCSNLDI